ncbi:TIGR03862 family flavoprotein [Chelatococcus sp. GCM10030263]|uniref:TIGR03862 family flavoprotein n=1 Tax=Chelatococcus sp. GCM10030263 TaxID=3273387 RepID=UPI00360A754F
MEGTALTATAAPARIAVIGGGPGGLMAAEVLARCGHAVTIYERMPSPGRKFLMAGRGGLNLTHSEPLEHFLTRYGTAGARLAPAIQNFPPEALRDWCHGLGIETFVGTSGRVFPKTLKASPLLRAWLARLGDFGVTLAARHSWTGFAEDRGLTFAGPGGDTVTVAADAALLALGGASWARLGSDGTWQAPLAAQGVTIKPLRPANCGFLVDWSEHARRFAGEPLKRIALAAGGRTVRGEAMITASGLEGGAIYALSGFLRDTIAAAGTATLSLDLRPDLSAEVLAARLARPRGRASLSNHLRKAVGLSPAAIAVLRESSRDLPNDPEALARHIKAAPLKLTGTASIARAISTAGGIAFDEIDDHYMLRRLPGVFVAGEMLDWEAPTGGYLLQAVFSTAVTAAEGIAQWLGRDRSGIDIRSTHG